MLASFIRRIGIGIGLACMPALAVAAEPMLDRSDPSLIEEELRREAPSTGPAVVASSDDPAPSESAIGEAILVGAVRVEGADMLSPADFAPIIDSYVGRTLSPGELRSLATDIANVARGRGYGLSSAWIPPQRVTAGVLRVVLNEGRVDEIEVEGRGARVVERMLSPLIGSRAVQTAELERRLLLAGDVAGVSLGKPRLDRRGDRQILRLRTARDPVRGVASIDNWGSSAVGPVRARLTVDFNGLLADDDRLTLAGVVTPLQPREFALARHGYRKGLGTGGTEIEIGSYVAHSRPGGPLAGRGIEGRSAEASIGVSHPFVRSRAASLWGNLELAVRDAEQDRRGARIRDDRLATLTAGAFTAARLGEGRGRFRVSLVQGLDMLGATEGGDPLASREDADGSFSKFSLWGEYERPLDEGFSLQLQAEGQIATGPLLSSEEMGLGGRYFLRGYDYREFSGDKGVVASAELRYDLKSLSQPFDTAQLYAYADAGSVSNYDGGSGGGSLASAGGGVRLRLGKVEAGFELGVPLSEGFGGSDHDPRLSFTIGTRF